VLLALALSAPVPRPRGVSVSDGVAGAGIVGAAGAFVVGEAAGVAAGLDGFEGAPAVEVGETWFAVDDGELDGCALALVVTVVLFVVLGDAEEPEPGPPPGFEGVVPGQTLLRAPLSEPRSPEVQLLLVLAQEKAEAKKPARWLQRQAVSERSDLHPTFVAAVCTHATAQSGMSSDRVWAATCSIGAAARSARRGIVEIVFMVCMACIIG
jgi:hypothetical protein